jgi:nucleoside-diphosphate kinase
MSTEETLVLIKNDGIRSGHVGDIITRFERLGFKINDMNIQDGSIAPWYAHYEEHVGKSFFKALVERMDTAGSVIAIKLSGENVVDKIRRMTGSSNAAEALPGTIRGDFGTSLHKNVIHSSENLVAAKRELSIWFE